MKDMEIKDKKKSIMELIVEAQDLQDRLEEALKKQEITNKSMDNLHYMAGLRNKTDAIIASKSNLNLKNVKTRYEIFLNKADRYVDLDRCVSKAPSFDLKYKKKGTIQNFINDLKVRMVNVEIENFIKDVKRVEIALYREMKRMERLEEEKEISDKFKDIKSNIENI